MEKILIIIVIVGIVFNILSIFDIFNLFVKDKDKHQSPTGDKSITEPNLRDKIIAYSIVVGIIVIFLFLSFSGWFVIIRDYLDFIL
jgi:flagellar basal body-associated protein FliL